ncbi:DinB family protein [Paenibacillus sp. Soil522]|uniref:DinB family protein n=1 Tax=Paenibacillus sp. Soil522 TaxID=1736388 RepID=UPI0006FD7931|nr:DinB family protein [Paenibacillus sp. Soil522]KRE31597.1 damage-inducible protein DinB [Paenibacillus sp. Soil522]
MTNHVVRFYDYHVWANKIIFNRLKELPRHLYNQEIQSVFPSVSKVMAHIYKVDCGWLDILMGKSMKEAIEDSFQLQEDAEARSLEELEVMYDDLSMRFKTFINEHEDIEKEVVLDNPYAGILNTRYSEFIIQVVNHGTYHRGNLSAMLRQMGHSSVMTEYGLFMYKDESNTSMTTAPTN